MKTLPLLLLCFVASAATRLFAEETPAVDYRPLAVECAVQFLGGEKTDDAALTQFFTEKQLAGKKLQAAIKQAVGLGRALIEDGTPANSPHFARLIKNSLGDATAASTAGAKTTAAATTKPSEEDVAKARSQLFTSGLAHFRALAPDVQLYLLSTLGLDRDDVIENLAALEKQAAPSSYDQDKPAHRFLLRYGYAEEKRATAKKETTPTDAQKSADSSISDVLEVQLLPQLTEETFWRDKGIIFGAGGGAVVLRGSGAAVATTTVRWNLRQAKTTARWNRLIGFKNPYYRPITYHGRVLYYETPTTQSSPSSLTAYRSNSTSADSSLVARWSHALTCNGPLLGSAISGDTIEFTSGTKERPYLVGWSLGWGYADHAASLVYLDLAATVSPSSGMRHSRPYVGISLDGELFGKLIDYVRNNKKPSTTE